MESDKEYDRIMGALDGDPEQEAVIERDKRMSECFRRVFSTDEGRLVLHQLLTDLRFYDECVTDTDIALNNFAKFMIFKRLKCDNYKQMTSAIFDCNKH
jgi:hypothetical protein